MPLFPRRHPADPHQGSGELGSTRCTTCHLNEREPIPVTPELLREVLAEEG